MTGKLTTIFHKISFFIFVWFLCLVILTNPGLAKKHNFTKFLLVVSRDSKPYLECEQGVKSFIENHYKLPHEIISIHLESKDISNVKKEIKLNTPDIAICIGTRATYLLKEINQKFPWVATFLIDKAIEALKKQGIVAVSMDVPLEIRIATLCRIKDHIYAAALAPNTPLSPKRSIRQGPCKNRDAYVQIFPFLSSIEIALKKLLDNAVNAFFITPDPEVFNSQEAVQYTLLWGLRNKIAICGLSSGYVRNGALFALEADAKSLGEQTAQLALDRLLGKIKGDIVIQHPKKLLLSINLKTAKRLGIEVPESVLKDAQVIIQ